MFLSLRPKKSVISWISFSPRLKMCTVVSASLPCATRLSSPFLLTGFVVGWLVGMWEWDVGCGSGSVELVREGVSRRVWVANWGL